MKSIKRVYFRESQAEWAARFVLTAVFLFALPMFAGAQGGGQLDPIATKLKSGIAVACNAVIGVVIVYRGVMIGISYMAKDDSERGEEDSRKLKSGLIRLAVGAAIALGATNLVAFVVGAFS